MDVSIISNSVQETIEIGQQIGSQLHGAEIICLVGPLGSGKTHLIKGIAGGAGADNAEHSVNSPTFVIINEYCGKFDIYHIDCYRLESLTEFELLGFDDYCYPDSVVLIEWADKIETLLDKTQTIQIELQHAGQNTRQIQIKHLPPYIRI